MNAPQTNSQAEVSCPSFCSVPLPRTVYAGPRSKEEFDRIDLPETIHEWKPDTTETLIRNDGKQYEQRCHSKCLGELGSSSVAVIFQWFERRVVAGGAV